MKSFKKILTSLVVVAMLITSVMSLASCGNSLFEDNTFKIGATGPLTGEAASYGTSVKQGAQLAVKHLNAKGGIQFSFAILDDEAGVEGANSNYVTLADKGMQFSLGAVTSGSGEAFASKANTDGIFCMTPSGSADPVIKDKKYSFRLCFGDPDQGVLAANRIQEDGFTTVGAIYDESDPYSSGIYAAFKERMEALGISYIERKFDKENNKDFSTQANDLKDCDVIFMPFYYTEASLFIKAAAIDKKSEAVFFGCDGFDGIAGLVEEVENKIMYITPFDANSEEANVKEFVAAYQAEYGKTPDQFAADAYDVVMVLAAALEKAGVTDYTISAQEIGDILYNTITAADFSYDGLTGSGMVWSTDGKCSKEPKIVTLN